ncbi:MAG: aminoacetone oxidase family FAD-binding enzyme [Clostridia bacterium]|nr:aminoacetone oxidase family FAD-binding enzyme [Clostridia bacterium]
MRYDIAVVGGGAAGMCAAIFAAQRDRKLKIVVLEALDRVGKKLITTGNGRCNITNRDQRLCRYHGEDVSFAENVFAKVGIEETVRFFSSIGVEISFIEDGRAYPSGFQASGVVDAMRFALEENGIEVQTDTRVENIVPKKDSVVLETSKGRTEASAVILASGLLAGGPKVGSDGSVFCLLKKMGYRSSEPTPGIVQLKTPPEAVRSMKGIHFDCLVSLYNGKKLVRSEFGELLFAEYGLSGPPVLQVSRAVSKEKGKFEVSLDLADGTDRSKLKKLLFRRREQLALRASEEFLTGFLNKRVGQVILKLCGVPFGSVCGKITDGQLEQIAAVIKDFRFPVTGTTGMANAQVSAGGISVSDFSSETLESRRHHGIFAAGELLDVDGDCGGYNLQWAWSSAMVAAESAVKLAEKRR